MRSYHRQEMGVVSFTSTAVPPEKDLLVPTGKEAGRTPEPVLGSLEKGEISYPTTETYLVAQPAAYSQHRMR
jgi:hypothetical protein